MTSEIINRAACLAELISNPKSFFNCPDLHGGSGLPEGSFRSGEMDPPSNLGKRNGVTSKHLTFFSKEKVGIRK